MKKLRISVVIDNPNSWMHNHIGKLIAELHSDGHHIKFCKAHAEIEKGDIAIFLSCEKIVPSEILKINKHNLVVHESDLPKGKGWSPLTWQVLEGKNEMPITLFEAAEKVDSGVIYYKDKFILQGHELIDEMRKKQAEKTFELIIRFIDKYPDIKGVTQNGKETFYRKRTPEDSELDISKAIKDQINLLRVVDNERYPAFFYYLGHRYILKIFKNDKVE